METLPIYIKLVFALTTLFALLLFYKAGKNVKPTAVIIVWLALQAAISLTGFYTITTGVPPRFALLLIPPIVFVISLFLTKPGKRLVDSLDVKTLTLLQIVRIPVELTLYWLFLHKAIPQVMTFEGRNFDILCGITAPFIYYFGYIKNVLGRKILISWNIICLLLLANIVVTAALSAPFSFQRLGFDHPNIALFYFPFVWLPCFVVPVALFSHLAALRRVRNND